MNIDFVINIVSFILFQCSKSLDLENLFLILMYTKDSGTMWSWSNWSLTSVPVLPVRPAMKVSDSFKSCLTVTVKIRAEMTERLTKLVRDETRR